MQQHFSRSQAANSKKITQTPRLTVPRFKNGLLITVRKRWILPSTFGLILGSQKRAGALLEHFGSLTVLARASVEELFPFVSRSKALRLVSSLRMGAVALREERQPLAIDSPLAVADLCSEMLFLDRELLRVVLLDAKRHLSRSPWLAKERSMNRSLIAEDF